MTPSPATLAAKAPFPYGRLMRDIGIATILNVTCGVVITLVNGNMRLLYSHIVYSMCIGTVAMLLIGTARLLILDRPGGAMKRWIPFTGVVVAAAPISNYTGSVLGSLLLGRPVPPLESFTVAREANMIAFTLLAATVAVMIFVSRDRMMRVQAEAAREKARAETIERQALQAQLQLLQAQVEPHMLFNTLANLQGLIAIDPERASHMLDQLIQYLRATLTSSRAQATTLEHEFALIDAYLGLMSVRMGERLSYSLDLPEALREVSVPPMLLQPLVENAIIHGLEPKMSGGEIAVAVALRGEMLELCVRDTGLGLGATSATAGTKVGVSNTRDRLRGLYGARACLDLEPAVPQGTVARLTLPLELP